MIKLHFHFQLLFSTFCKWDLHWDNPNLHILFLKISPPKHLNQPTKNDGYITLNMHFIIWMQCIFGWDNSCDLLLSFKIDDDRNIKINPLHYVSAFVNPVSSINWLITLILIIIWMTCHLAWYQHQNLVINCSCGWNVWGVGWDVNCLWLM